MSYTSMEQRLQRGEIVLLDGGTGTELERRGAPVSAEAWCGLAAVDSLEILEGVHRDYIAAGADVVTANTYASSRLMLAPAGVADRFEEINRSAIAAARRAREASGRDHVLIAGSLSQMCPLAAGTDRSDLTREPPPEVMRDAFHELAQLHRDEGCDLILLEMMYYPHRMALAFEAALATGLPVWAGFSVRREASGDLVGFAPEQAIAFGEILNILDDCQVQAAGVMHSPSNLVGEASAMLRERYQGPLLAYPDSGYFRMPRWQFEDVIAPAHLVEFARGWVRDGVQILGGCCGLSPAHIAALRDAFADTGA